MDQILTAKIYNFLQIEHPTEAQIVEGATLLLQCHPTRNRGIYNSALRRPMAMLPWIRADLKKYYGIRQRGLTTPEVEQYNNETVARVEETLSLVPSGIVQEGEDAPAIPILGTRGMREDHDRLPADIQALWERNADRWKRMARLHFQLAQMIARPDYAACDGNELCYQLRQEDDDLRRDYETYDTYTIPATPAAVPDVSTSVPAPDSVDAFADQVKAIAAARTAITRGLQRKTQTDESLKKLQDAVDLLFNLKQTVKPGTVEKLRAIGITIPTAAVPDVSTSVSDTTTVPDASPSGEATVPDASPSGNTSADAEG